MDETNEPRWLLLIHQIPPKPSYLRVKIWRRLQRIGAVAIKNSVYALPRSDQAQEDLQWILREIAEGGGDASVVEARFVEGLSDGDVEQLFQTARDADYAQIAEETHALIAKLPSGRRALGPLDKDEHAGLSADLTRLKRRMVEVGSLDFFGAPGRGIAETVMSELSARLFPPEKKKASKSGTSEAVRGSTWVTRKGIHVDRMASAWLIRRFIDPACTFKFVPPKGYEKEKGELRFDMFEAEYTHVGDRCTFEVLIERFALDDAALQPIAEIVHDVDVKDAKFERPETAGIEHLIAGIAVAHRDDLARLDRASAVLDDLYAFFKRRK